MDITATKLQLIFGVLALAALAASVWAWPRLSGRTWRSILGRIGVLLGNQVFTLLALALVINAYFGFYGSWSDLLGTDQAATATIVANGEQGIASGSDQVRVIRSTRVPLPHAKGGHSGGEVEEVIISGATSGLSSPAYVYLPPQYFQKKYAHRRFPALVALTGYPGDARNLITRENLPGLAAKMISRHEMPPTVMVLTRPTVAPPRDTECVDVPGGPQVETYFTKDLRKSMADAFRVGTGAANWGVLGGSTGGYCALKLTMRHPEAFSAAVALSGYYQAAVDVTTGDLFGGSQRLRDENDLMWRLANLPVPPVSVLVTSSRVGEADFGATQRFLAAAKPPMRASSLILPSGGHNFATWNRELPQVLPWLAQQLHAPGN